MAVPGFEPGSFDSWFSAPSMRLPWLSGKSESDCSVTWMSMPLVKQGRQEPFMGLNSLPLSDPPRGTVGPRQRTLQSWLVCLSEVFARAGGKLGDGMLAWHVLGPRTARREQVSRAPNPVLCLHQCFLKAVLLKSRKKRTREVGREGNFSLSMEGHPDLLSSSFQAVHGPYHAGVAHRRQERLQEDTPKQPGWTHRPRHRGLPQAVLLLHTLAQHQR